MKKTQINLNIRRGNMVSYALLAATVLLGFSSCKKQLDVKDPNDPTLQQTLILKQGWQPMHRVVFSGTVLIMVMAGWVIVISPCPGAS